MADRVSWSLPPMSAATRSTAAPWAGGQGGQSQAGEPGEGRPAAATMPAPAPEAAGVDRTLTTVATFHQPAQAELARNALTAAGIPAVVADAEIVAMDWLLANAV